MKSICIIAKGPSAENASQWINEEDDIATINDSMNLIPSIEKIDYLFFSHPCMLNLIDENRNKVKFFVSPIKPIDGEAGLEYSPYWLKDCKNHITYEDCTCPYQKEGIIKKITEGGIAHFHTTTAAIHWLCKFGKYEKIRIIGVDGGIKHAKGSYVYEEPILQNKDIYNIYKIVTESICDICSQIYGVKFEWYK